MIINVNWYTDSGQISVPCEVSEQADAGALYHSLYREWRDRGENSPVTIQIGTFGYEKTHIHGLSVTTGE